MTTRGALHEARIATLLRAGFRTWDEWGARSDAAHGVETLLRQEAHRIACTVAMLEAAPRRLLEIGTGYLTLAGTLRHAFPQATIAGVEHPGRAYVFAPTYRKALEAARVVFATTDLVVDGLPFRARTFDAVVFAEVIEHLPPSAVPDVLAEIGRVLMDDGVLVLTTPNLTSWTNRELVLRGHSPHQSPLRAIDGTYAHLRLYTMAELTELCEAVGFRVTRRAFVDQVAAGISPLRRGLRAVLAPARGAWPVLRDTCMVQAVRAGRGGGGPCPP